MWIAEKFQQGNTFIRDSVAAGAKAMRPIGWIAILVFIGSISGCANAPENQMVAVRTDGAPVKGNAAYMQAFELDRTICMGEAQKANIAGGQIVGGLGTVIVASMERAQQVQQVLAGCLAQRGYVVVPDSQAELVAAQFRATALATGSTNAPAAPAVLHPLR